MIEQRPPLLLRLKLLLRDVHRAVWRRVELADSLSIADLHRVIQLLMGWDDDHLHRFRIHGRDYGIAYVGGPSFDEDAAVMRLAQFGFRPTERFLYEYDFTAGWQVEVRVEKVIEEAPCESHRIPACLVGREPGPPDGSDGPRAHADRRCDAVSWDMATDMDAVAAVLRRVADGDDAVLADPETFSDFKQAVSRLQSRHLFPAEAFPRAAINAALRQAFTTTAARNYRIDCVLVWKLDRSARSTRHLLTALKEFNHLGVRFVSVQDHFVRSHARGQAGRLKLAALLKSRQDLGYFPPPDAFPDTILTARWRWDARITSASHDETDRASDHCVHLLIHATIPR